jgi:hypothetical protein
VFGRAGATGRCSEPQEAGSTGVDDRAGRSSLNPSFVRTRLDRNAKNLHLQGDMDRDRGEELSTQETAGKAAET